MTVLVLAEKPSAARNMAKALGGFADTYNDEDFKIANLRGHVLGLVPPEMQVPSDKADEMREWKLERLPWNLDELAWRKGVLKDCKGLLQDLKEQLSDVDEVAIATDDDPSGEGELLAWEALEWCKWNGPTTRMYFVDEAPKSIQKAFRERKRIESMEADGDFLKAVARERWDFASMQFTRAASCLARTQGYRTVVRQGRLKSVMVKLVGDQQKAYESYVKKPFFEARFKDSNGNVFARKVDDPEDIRFATEGEVDLSGLHESTVMEDSRTLKHTKPGKLLDLSALSAILAKQGCKPKRVLETYQKMYEAQVVSYPRTEDKVITPEQFDELLPLAPSIARVVGVDPGLLTHTEPRREHVREGGAHGANRPGPSVPDDLEGLAGKYGEEAPAIYKVLACNYLAMLCEDYEYELVKGHVTDFPEYVGTTRIPVPNKPSFKDVFDAEAQSKDEGEDEGEGSKEFCDPAVPYVHEGANPRPPRPTMKWLNKKLEKYNVGTGATRTSTLADVTKPDKGRELMLESKGVLKLSDCGRVSYTLLDGCQIADPAVTEQLFEAMDRVGRFELAQDAVLATCNDMVMHDASVMSANAPQVKALGIKSQEGGKGDKTPIGECPRCGKKVMLGDNSAQCESNKYKKREDGTWKLAEGCGFGMNRRLCGKKLSEKVMATLLAKGRCPTVKGFKSKRTGKAFDAPLTFDYKGCHINFDFDSNPNRRK